MVNVFNVIIYSNNLNIRYDLESFFFCLAHLLYEWPPERVKLAFFFLSGVYQLLPVFFVPSTTFFQRRTGLKNAGQGLEEKSKERERVDIDYILLLQEEGTALQQKSLLITKHTYWHTCLTGCVQAGPHLIEWRANPVDIANLHVR